MSPRIELGMYRNLPADAFSGDVIVGYQIVAISESRELCDGTLNALNPLVHQMPVQRLEEAGMLIAEGFC
jgi:hypothetical protein